MVKKRKVRKIFCDTDNVQMQIYEDVLPDFMNGRLTSSIICPICHWELWQVDCKRDVNKLEDSIISLGARTYLVRETSKKEGNLRQRSPNESIPF